MYISKYYTCPEIDQRLLQGYYDDAVHHGFQGTIDDFWKFILSIKDCIKTSQGSVATQNNFSDELKAKLDGIENGARNITKMSQLNNDTHYQNTDEVASLISDAINNLRMAMDPKFSNIDDRLNQVYPNMKYITLRPESRVVYSKNFKRFGLDGKYSPELRILLKFYGKRLIIDNYEKIIRGEDISISLIDIANRFMGKLTYMYVGRCSYKDVYVDKPVSPYNDISFDIYLNKTDEGDIKIQLVPVPISNSYTLNCISGKQMIKVFSMNNVGFNSERFVKLDFVEDSPIILSNNKRLIGMMGYINPLDSMVYLSNGNNINFTIRYPRWLNAVLTFLKYSRFGIIEVDETPDVVDGSYVEVTLEPNEKLLMYGDINSIKPGIFTSSSYKGLVISNSNNNSTNYLLELGGDVSALYNYFKLNNLNEGYYLDDLILEIGSLKLFNSPLIGRLDFNNSQAAITTDPILPNKRIYTNMFSESNVESVNMAIHLLKGKSYIKLEPKDEEKGVWNNYEYAFNRCPKLRSLYITIYLEGDLNLDSVLDENILDNAVTSIFHTIDGSDKVSVIYFKIPNQYSLSAEQLDKFKKLIKPVIDKIKSIKSGWTVQVI